MTIYDQPTRTQIRGLRLKGYTYNEIGTILHSSIPRSTLSYICRGLTLDSTARERIAAIIRDNVAIAREKALIVNRAALSNRITSYQENNRHLSGTMHNHDVQIIALAMLYLGEGAKWQRSRAPKLGSSNPMIVRLYIDLLHLCYAVPRNKLWARIQHRADQNSAELLLYWSRVTGIEQKKFYPCYVDNRTIGKKTLKPDYKGVCTIGCAGTHIQLELQQIAAIIGDTIRGISAVG